MQAPAALSSWVASLLVALALSLREVQPAALDLFVVLSWWEVLLVVLSLWVVLLVALPSWEALLVVLPSSVALLVALLQEAQLAAVTSWEVLVAPLLEVKPSQEVLPVVAPPR
jgi:hypothetical protein